jgi:hypothetical protein
MFWPVFGKGKKIPLRLAFPAREGVVEWLVGAAKRKSTPPTCVWSEGGGSGGGWVPQSEKAPLRLAFGARKGVVVVGGCCKAKKHPSDSRLEQGRG